MYIADQLNSRIRKVTVTTGVISTYVGTGTVSYSGDSGQASSAALSWPSGVALDATGTNILHYFYLLTYLYIGLLGNMYLFIADQGNHRIRKVTISTGIITTIAGNGGTGSYSGDNGQATSAALYGPSGITLDASGRTRIISF